MTKTELDSCRKRPIRYLDGYETYSKLLVVAQSDAAGDPAVYTDVLSSDVTGFVGQ